MDANAVLDRLTARIPSKQESQNVVATAEEQHPWRVSRSQALTVPLLRIWDHKSGSQPDERNCLMSRAPQHRLDTVESRKASLSTHLDHKVWVPTPFISFTTSAVALEELANFRAQRPYRGAQTLTVVDPNVRLAAGRPILDVAAEMGYYGIIDPYGRSNQFYQDHYVCLWQVTGDEVIGKWDWNELVNHEHWYDEVVMPAFRRKLATQSPREEPCELSAVFTRLSLTSDHFDQMYCSSASDSPSARFPDLPEVESPWDTDDEAEESNVADDIIKFIEGDW